MFKTRHISVLIILIATLLSSVFAAENKAVLQTKNKLKELDAQISKLKQTLASANDKRGVLNQELSNTEKQIGQGIQQLRHIQQGMQDKQHTIVALEQKVKLLNEQLLKQQQLLAQHITARYKTGEYEPLKLIITQNEPYSINRLLTYYQYIIHSRQQIIDEIDTTRSNLTQSQQRLQDEVTEQKTLHQQLLSHQQQLEQNKQYHTTLIQTLNQDIQNKQHALTEVEQNKENLARLLKTLALESVTQPKQPFLSMRHKLPKPVHADKQAITSMNQGVTFFAGEGTPVNAVYPGKVVFSDWLNGYGLLLIIDHGQGFMTLYAHNQSLFKQKGASVAQGEQIASVGHSGGIKQNGLYFEVRQRGKAVSPLDWLS